MICFQIRVGLGQREQIPQTTAQRLFCSRQRGHGQCIGRATARHIAGSPGLVACVDHGFQRGLLMLQVFSGDIHQIGNQVIAAFELHVNLPKGIGDGVFKPDQTVVRTHSPENEQCRKGNIDQIVG